MAVKHNAIFPALAPGCVLCSRGKPNWANNRLAVGVIASSETWLTLSIT